MVLCRVASVLRVAILCLFHRSDTLLGSRDARGTTVSSVLSRQSVLDVSRLDHNGCFARGLDLGRSEGQGREIEEDVLNIMRELWKSDAVQFQ
jgi:hypothetical protein